MAGTTPHVERDTLTVGAPGAEHAIAVGTPAWFRWLETATAFTFVSPHGTFTARRERASSGRGGWYWRAYRRRAGVRRRAYLGKAEELTLEQLHAVADSLNNPAVPAVAPTRRGAAAVAPIDDLQASPALPTGTVTFLFTDIEGSTQLWEKYPQAMPTVLARHNTLLDQPIGAHHGVVFKTVGDSVHAAFASATDALAAALAIQRSLQQEPWDLPTPLRVRMALHSGTAEPRDGDYIGPQRGRLTRLLALSHGGQVLLSAGTAQLVRDQLPPSVTLREMGSYQLTELAHPDAIFQLVSPNLPSNFPPLRGASAAQIAPRVELLATKLYMPRPRPDLVARPRLFARLDAGLQRVLTLVCAPAGFGKTTLLASWLNQIADCRLQIADLDQPNLQSTIYNLQFRRVAWLALDARDSDPAVFVRYLVAALQVLAPAVGTTTLTMLQSPQPPQPEALLTALINDLAGLTQESILVLDDYHALNAPAIHQAVSFLIEHLPPALHLVIATREDPPLPLSRLRARRLITELRADQLRFTADEAATFLTELMGLALTAADIAALESRTEGWIAGLQLAALAMQDRADYAGFMAAFTGSNRFIVDYLADEVLSRQPRSIQTFLIQTSILDRMCGPLCDAILGRTENQEPRTEREAPGSQLGTLWVVLGSGESYSQLLLEQLERANLFVTPLDAERRWYRYHHLFGEVLRERLRIGATTAEIATLHRRASAWYEQQGLLPEAVQHALATGDHPLAARLLESLARPMQLRGEMITVMGWLAALPNDVLRAHPHLGVIYAWGLATTGQVPAAELWIQDVERSLAEHPDRSNLLGEVTVIRVVIALVQGDYPRTLERAHQALAYLSDDQLPLRALTNMSLGAAYTAQGDLVSAGQSFAQASALYQAAGHIELALAPLRQLCRIQLVQGRLNQEVGFITLARVLIAQGEYEHALALLARLLATAEAGRRMGRVIELLALQAPALHAHGRETEALIALERALLLAEPEGYIRIFVDEGPQMATLLRAAHSRSSVPHYIDKLLAAFGELKIENEELKKPVAASAIPHSQFSILNSQLLVEPLSERELEVLQLLAAGLSNQEIANRLVIALSTVKKHLNNVYTKLEVESRTQATVRARELNLI